MTVTIVCEVVLGDKMQESMWTFASGVKCPPLRNVCEGHKAEASEIDRH